MAGQMSALSDAAERLRALQDHDTTLLVEAAAGTGKTALIAGRVTMMLTQGVEPRHVAALSYNEFAASELSERIGGYVQTLLAGKTPDPLKVALPNGMTSAQRSYLEEANAKLDQLTSCTIHAFCQTLLTAYAIDATIDPGARILDAQAQEAVLDYVFDAWLERRLSSGAGEDPINYLAAHDPRGVARTLRRIAKLRLEFRNAKAPEPTLGLRPDQGFADAVAALRQWSVDAAADNEIEATVVELEQLAACFVDLFAPQTPDFERLWQGAHPPAFDRIMRKPPAKQTERKKKKDWNRNLKAPALEKAWKGEGAGKAALKQAFKDRYARCATHYQQLMGHVAAWLMWRLSNELDDLIEDYKAYKRRSALLDFDDLLYFARDLVRENEAARRSIAERFRHILVDEFQDTDPIQAELFFRLAAHEAVEDWTKGQLRPGALFAVGDPKQAIYAFRGADVSTYDRAYAAIAAQGENGILNIRANFRSRPPIIDHVNACFDGPLSVDEQPGYVALDATLPEAGHNHPHAARLTINAPQGSDAKTLRECEANAVAELCARLIGQYPVKDGVLAAGGIALLAPTHTDLKIYETALARLKLPFVSQAGKGLFERQETQDLLALTRTLADPTDTLAFGALMRGPLVGLSEEELLDITAVLPELEFGARFSLFTDASLVDHPVAADTLETLQDLQRRARDTTPFLILSEAIERLNVRPKLALRGGGRDARSWANIEVVLERARPFAISGIAKFAAALQRDWASGDNIAEGRLDADAGAIQIVTMHSAKGLEWPVVIPINSTTRVWTPREYVHRADTNTLHWIIDDVRDPELAAALDNAASNKRQENTRLWYVACTRACELLVVPEFTEADVNSYARIVGLGQSRLKEWDMDAFEGLPAEPPEQIRNQQTRAVFDRERERIKVAATPTRWRAPSDHDGDRLPALAVESADTAPALLVEGAGSLRGLIMHKLIEEVLTREADDNAEALTARASSLTQQLAAQLEATGVLPAAKEMADRVLATLALPEIAAVVRRQHP